METPSEKPVNSLPKRANRKNSNLLRRALMVAALLALVVGPSYYFYRENQQARFILENPEVQAEQEASELVEQVSKHLVLPDETPTVATVSDADQLKKQPFFKSAENGDKVLVYVKAKKAILYRQSIDRVIETSPLNFTTEKGTTKN